MPAPIQPPSILSGPGGLPVIDVHNAHARARISLYGAHLLSFQPLGASAGGLFVSERAIYQVGKAIRGGVPICWPWFGADPQGLGRPSHGLARTRLWELRGSRHMDDGQTELVLGLCDSADTRALWPHAFDLTLTVTVGQRLRLALTTRNTGDAPFTITQALHSYWAVGDSAQAVVTGLDGCHYLDKTTGATQQQLGAVRFGGELDRVYNGVPSALTLEDPALRRRIQLRSEGSQTVVLWNPWERTAAAMADLRDDEYQRFVCVETANAGQDEIHLQPGATHCLAMEAGCEAL